MVVVSGGKGREQVQISEISTFSVEVGEPADPREEEGEEQQFCSVSGKVAVTPGQSSHPICLREIPES